MNADDATARKKRLLHRSRYRGFLESDLVFARFAAAMLEALDPAQLDRYERLLDESDQDLWAWLVGRRAVPADHDNDVLAMIRAFHGVGRGG
jgi:antitoxin CptB